MPGPSRQTVVWPAACGAVCKVPGHAVDRRAETIPAEHVTKARKIDQKFNGTAAGVQGPFETALKAHGPSGRCVDGCAFDLISSAASAGSSTRSDGRGEVEALLQNELRLDGPLQSEPSVATQAVGGFGDIRRQR